jgi:hypothetical protein
MATAVNTAQGETFFWDSTTYEQHIRISLRKQTAGIPQPSQHDQEFARNGNVKKATHGL